MAYVHRRGDVLGLLVFSMFGGEHMTLEQSQGMSLGQGAEVGREGHRSTCIASLTNASKSLVPSQYEVFASQALQWHCQLIIHT